MTKRVTALDILPFIYDGKNYNLWVIISFLHTELILNHCNKIKKIKIYTILRFILLISLKKMRKASILKTS